MSTPLKVWLGPSDELVRHFDAMGRHVEVEEVDDRVRGVTFSRASFAIGFDDLPPASLYPQVVVLPGDRLYVCFICRAKGGTDFARWLVALARDCTRCPSGGQGEPGDALRSSL